MDFKLPQNPHDAVDYATIKQLEQGLINYHAIRRGTLVTLTLSLDDTIIKLTKADDQTIEAFLALAEDSFAMLTHFKTHLGFLESGQARLLSALTECGLIGGVS